MAKHPHITQNGLKRRIESAVEYRLISSNTYHRWRNERHFATADCESKLSLTAIQMRVIPSALKRLPDSVVTMLTLVVAIGSSILVGAGIGYLVVVLWFSNTRSDGAAAFLIAAIASGLFTSVVLFVTIVSRHHAPSPKTVVLPAGLWLIVVIQLTWTVCKGSFIAAHNVLWILKSGDQRIYELNWLITGWLAIFVSLAAALFASRLILRVRRSHLPQRPTTSSLNC